MGIVSRSYPYNNSISYKKSDFIDIKSETTLKCKFSLINEKSWIIYMLNKLTGINEKQIFLDNNPTVNYAEMVIQPNSLAYGLYRFVYTVKMTGPNLNNFQSQIDTFIQVIPSGLVISALKSSQPMYGGTIEITRGYDQQIQFDPFLNSYDIDSIAIMTSLTFKYSCQIIDSNVKQGYPVIPSTNQTVYLDQIIQNSNLITYNTCFGNTLNLISFDSTLNRLTLNEGSLVYVPNIQYEIYVSTMYYNIEYYQKVLINILPPPKLPIPIITYKIIYLL